MRSTTLLALAVSGALAGAGAAAAAERIVCEQEPAHPSMSNCVLIPAAQAAGGSSAQPDRIVTYYVAEPLARTSRDVVVIPGAPPDVALPPESQALSQPAPAHPYPGSEHERVVVLYIVDPALPAASAGDAVIVPAQRIIITEPAVPGSSHWSNPE